MKSLIFLALFFSGFAWMFGQTLNQQKIDSIYSELNKKKSVRERANLFDELRGFYADLSPDSTIKYARKSLTIYNKIGAEDTTIIDLNYHLGVAYLDLNLKKARFYIKRSLNQSLTIENERFKSLNFLAYAAYYSRVPNLDSSTYYLVRATEYFIDTKDSLPLAYCYYGIMSNYSEAGNLKRTIEYGEKTLKIAKSFKINHLIGPTAIGLAHSYFEAGNDDQKAERYALEAERIATKDNNKNLLLEVYLATGIHNYKNDNYKFDWSQSYHKVITLRC